MTLLTLPHQSANLNEHFPMGCPGFGSEVSRISIMDEYTEEAGQRSIIYQRRAKTDGCRAPHGTDVNRKERRSSR